MSLFIESIQVRDGKIPLLPWHTKRFNRTRKDRLGITEPVDLGMLPEFADPPQAGFFKYRILYNQSIQSIEFEPYRIRKIHSLRLIADDTIRYKYKEADRSHLKALFAKRGMDDDIIIVKNGLLTDTYYSNIVLENEDGLFTPKTPLLPGVRRAHLLAKGQVEEIIIRVEDLSKFQRVHLVNAMLDLDDCVVAVKDVYAG